MIPYRTFDVLQIGPLSVNFYGFFWAVGTLAVILFAKYFAKKKKVDVEIIEDLSIYLILGTIIGARLFYVLFFIPEGVEFTFIDIFKVWEGGLAFFGGFIGAIIAGLIYVRKKNLEFLKFADIFTIPLVIGHILGRFGAYLIGNQPGKEADLPWSIYYMGALRHPVELYDLIGLIIIAGVLYYIYKNFKLKSGVLFAIYVFLYSSQRVVVDFFRTEMTDPLYFYFTASQYISFILIVMSLTFIIQNLNKKDLKIKNKNK